MSYNKLIVLFFAVFATMCSCKVHTNDKAVKTQQVNDQSSQNIEDWNIVLNNAVPDVKEYWFNLIDNDWGYFKKNAGVDLTAKDFSSLTIKAMPVYRIDSVASYNFEGQLASGSITVDRSKGVFFALKEDKLVAVVFPKLENGKWVNDGGYGCVPLLQAEKIVKLLADKQRIYQLNVYAFPSTKQAFKGYFVYKNNDNQWMILRQNGQELALGPELALLTVRAKEAEIEWNKLGKP